MSLTLDDKISSGVPGVYINKGVVLSVDDKSGEDAVGLSRRPDVLLFLTLDIGRDFSPVLRLHGTFKRNDKNEVIGWGSGFIFRNFFPKIGCKGGLTPEGRIPKEWLDALVGKTILRLSYASKIREKDGKLMYSDLNDIRVGSEDPLKWAREFKANYETTGFPKNFHPELLDLRDMDFPGTLPPEPPPAGSDPL